MRGSAEIWATLCRCSGLIRLLTSALTAAQYRCISHVLKPQNFRRADSKSVPCGQLRQETMGQTWNQPCEVRGLDHPIKGSYFTYQLALHLGERLDPNVKRLRRKELMTARKVQLLIAK
jgi:hypothetical protein